MRVLITGASSGIGETIAEELAAAGHQVGLMARRAERIRALARRLGGVAVPGDVAAPADCQAAVDGCVQGLGHLDALVNAAGTWVEEPLHRASYESIQDFVQTDVSGALHITRAVLPVLGRGGRILHINGLQGAIRQRPPVLYAAVEAAVRGLCESLRWEAAEYGVHVSLLTLGSVANAEAATPAAKVLEEEGHRTRLSRGEVAQAALFMLQRPAGVNVDELCLTPLNQAL